MLTQPTLQDAGAAELSAATVIAPGVASAQAYYGVDALPTDGTPAILLCDRISAEALARYDQIVGVLASSEEPSSHAAIVSRGSKRAGQRLLTLVGDGRLAGRSGPLPRRATAMAGWPAEVGGSGRWLAMAGWPAGRSGPLPRRAAGRGGRLSEACG